MGRVGVKIQMYFILKMNYAAIHDGGRVSMSFPGFSPKVNYIINKHQFIFLAKDTLMVRGISLIHAINGMVNH